MQTNIYYNHEGIKEKGNRDNINNGLNLWMDIVDPSSSEISNLQREFGLDIETLNMVEREAKRPQVRAHENYTFTILLDIRYITSKKLTVRGIYLYIGKNWLITIHSSEVDLLTPTCLLLKQKNRKIVGSHIDALYYSMITEIITKYEQLLTSIELIITDFDQKVLYSKDSKKTFYHLDIVTRQIIIIRRHFWYTRDVMNFLTHMEKDSEDIKYLQIAYDNINQLIELIESYRDGINSSRDLFMTNVALQTHDAIRVLTVINTILLPLTVITGIYGMFGINTSTFNSLPQVFFIAIATMILMILITLLFFKKKRWLFNSDNDLNRKSKEKSKK